MSDLNLRIAISIHALREEGDAGPAFPRCRPAISIHALREEGDAAKSMWNAQPAEFLSTPSARRATPPGQVQQIRHVDFYPRPPRGGRRAQGSGRAAERNFYPRPPRGGRPSSGALPGPALKISIHALREEGDGSAGVGRSIELISIHALREEGDTMFSSMRFLCIHFYPRPPRGGRHYVFEYAIPLYPFLSTPSARRATYDILGLQRTKEFLSTPSARRATRTTAFRTTTTPNFYPRPPRGGRLCPAWLRFCGCCYFYPRPPRGGRHQCAMSYITTFNISIHALREEGDWMISLSRAIPSISIHALREEGDTSVQ